jgi:hypothetical protein
MFEILPLVFEWFLYLLRLQVPPWFLPYARNWACEVVTGSAWFALYGCECDGGARSGLTMASCTYPIGLLAGLVVFSLGLCGSM